MTEKTITLQDKQYQVRFDLQTLINYEEITGKSLFNDNLMSIKSRIVVIMAAILSANSDTDLTIDGIMGNKDMKALMEIQTAYSVIDELAAVFFEIPEIEEKKNKKSVKDKKDKSEKNL